MKTRAHGASVKTVPPWRGELSVFAVWMNASGMNITIIIVSFVFQLSMFMLFCAAEVGCLLKCENFWNIFNKDSHM